MSIPTHDEITLPILKFLSDQKMRSNKEVLKHMVEYFELSEKERTKMASGDSKPLINNRVRWARFFLKKGGLVNIPQKGFIKITPKGVDIVNKNPKGIKINTNAQAPDSIEVTYFKTEKDSANEDVLPQGLTWEKKTNSNRANNNNNAIEKKELETLYKLNTITENIENKGVEAFDKLENITNNIEKKEIQISTKLDSIIDNIEKKESQASVKLDNMIENVERKIMQTLGKLNNAALEVDKSEPKPLEKLETIMENEEQLEVVPPEEQFRSARETEEETGKSEPDKMMQQGYKSIKSNLGQEILDKLIKCPFYCYEKIILKLLSEMGYGSGEVVNRSIDSRIEGFINPDKLGFDRIYFRAYKLMSDEAIITPMISDFVGSLDLNGVNKGVFITTSSFKKDFDQLLQNMNKIIILIDGKRLGELMLEYNIGVITENVYEIKKIDFEYFLEE
jgi:restriction system protein